MWQAAIGQMAGDMWQAGNVHRTNKARKKEAQKQRQFDWRMWNLQNEYNKPVNQMARFKEAGLNPNLMYQQGTHGNATDYPKYHAPQIDTPPAPNVGLAVQSYYDAQLKQANKDNIDQQTELLKKEGELKNLDILVKGSKDPKTKELVDVMMKRYQKDAQVQEVRKKVQEIDNLHKHGKLLDKDMSKKDLDIEAQQIENAMKKIDKKWLEDNKLSRLDPTLVKMIWRYAKQVKMNFKEALQHIMTNTQGGRMYQWFKN